MSEKSRVRIALLGQFSSGKSTLLNALLGRSLAATGVTPVTAAENRFVWSGSDSVRLVKEDGTEEPLRRPLEEVRALVSDRAVAASTRFVEFGLAADLLRVADLWDTPGYDSSSIRHEVVSRRAMAEADVVLWVSSIDHAANRDEVAKLKSIQLRSIPIVVVVTKVDLYDPDEVAEALEDIEQAFGALAQEVVPVSARDGFDARLAGDRDALRRSGLSRLESLLVDLSVGFQRDRSRSIRPGQRPDDVVCPSCDALAARDDRFCVCGRDLADQHRDCPRCETDNVVGRVRCRGCNLVFDDYAMARKLEGRAREALGAGLLVDAVASLRLAEELDPGSSTDDLTLAFVEEGVQRIDDLVVALGRSSTFQSFVAELGRLEEVCRGLAVPPSKLARHVWTPLCELLERGGADKSPGKAVTGTEAMAGCWGPPPELISRHLNRLRRLHARSLLSHASRSKDAASFRKFVTDSLQAGPDGYPDKEDCRALLRAFEQWVGAGKQSAEDAVQVLDWLEEPNGGAGSRSFVALELARARMLVAARRSVDGFAADVAKLLSAHPGVSDEEIARLCWDTVEKWAKGCGADRGADTNRVIFKLLSRFGEPSSGVAPSADTLLVIRDDALAKAKCSSVAAAFVGHLERAVTVDAALQNEEAAGLLQLMRVASERVEALVSRKHWRAASEVSQRVEEVWPGAAGALVLAESLSKALNEELDLSLAAAAAELSEHLAVEMGPVRSERCATSAAAEPTVRGELKSGLLKGDEDHGWRRSMALAVASAHPNSLAVKAQAFLWAGSHPAWRRHPERASAVDLERLAHLLRLLSDQMTE